MELFEKYEKKPVEEFRDAWIESLADNSVDGGAFGKYSHNAMLGSATAKDSISEATCFYNEATRAIWRKGLTLDKNSKILDFGCGTTARIGRTFLRNVPAAHIHGVDVVPDFVKTVKKDFPQGTFHPIAAKPPKLPFQDESFDYITAYSVFSHLSQAHGLDWLHEMSRTLKPNGVIFITSFGMGHYQTIMETPVDQLPPSRREAHRPFLESFGRFVEFMEMGEMVFMPGSGKGNYNHLDYGYSFMTDAYARRMWGGFLDLIYYVDHPDVLEQGFFALKKKSPD